MKKYFCVTAPDFPCFGQSERGDGAWSVGDYALWLKKFMDTSGLENPTVIAHSFGARVALKLFSDDKDKDRVKKLIITGGAGLKKERTPQYIRKVKRYRRIKKIFPKFAEKHFGSKEYRSLSPEMKESYKKIVNEDLRDCAEKISAPTYLIYGRDDTVTPAAEEGATFHKLIVGSKLKIVKGGHFCFSEFPEEFNNILLQFLSER